MFCVCVCVCVCVSVALIIQHGMRMHRIIFVIRVLSISTIFFHFYVINGTIFDKKLMKIKM